MEKPRVVDQKLVVFRVGRQEYAVPITTVREVVAWTQPTPVPEAPPIVEGVVDLRGEIFPVVDLGRRFQITRLKQGIDARIMVMELDGRHVGLIVDDVVEVHSPAPGAVTPPSPLLKDLTHMAADPVVAGILKVGENRLVVLLAVTHLLAGASLH